MLRQLKLQPDVIDRMPFYRVEFMLHFHKEYIKREKEEREKGDNSGGHNNMMKAAMSQQKNMMSTKNLPSIGKLPNIGKYK